MKWGKELCGPNAGAAGLFVQLLTILGCNRCRNTQFTGPTGILRTNNLYIVTFAKPMLQHRETLKRFRPDRKNRPSFRPARTVEQDELFTLVRKYFLVLRRRGDLPKIRACSGAHGKRRSRCLRPVHAHRGCPRSALVGRSCAPARRLRYPRFQCATMQHRVHQRQRLLRVRAVAAVDQGCTGFAGDENVVGGPPPTLKDVDVVQPG